ncbi:MAG: ribosome recycling factor [Thermoanaerobaculia bacterium]
MKELFVEVERKMKHALDRFHQELKTLRTGRASLAILDHVQVEYYGTPTPLNQLASLSVADPSLIVAQPYDPTVTQAIERAIQASGLGLNPASDGKVVRIPIPPLNEERRREMVKKAHDMAESTRNGVRQARREGNERLKAMEKEHGISQDDERRGLEEIQKLHDHYIAQTQEALEHREKDILTV